MGQKVNKNELLQNASTRTGMSFSDMKRAFGGIVDEIEDTLCSGRDVSLTGFGTFSLKIHKGHPVRFDSEVGKVKDYVVVKFIVSDVLMSDIRRRCGGSREPAEAED